jgi:hypothetical protein
MRRLIATSFELAFLLAICRGVAAEQPNWDFTPQPVQQIPAGTRFGNGPPAGWSQMVLFVEGRLASGDVDAVSNTVSYYSKLFNVVVLANAQQDAAGKHYLDKVGFGFAMVIKGQNTIVTPATHRNLGAGLSLIGSGILAINETALSRTVQIARSPSSMIIDAPTIMLHEGEHREMICRFAIWVAPQTGKIGAAAWLLDDNGSEDEDYRISQEVFQYLPENMREDRIMNVKKDRFTLGIPAKDAFGVVRIPQGTPFRFTDQMRAHAGARRFDAQRYPALWSSMAAAMAQPPVTAKRDSRPKVATPR